jgi:hypothetical protein
MRLFLHLIRTSLGVFLDALTFIHLLAPAHWLQLQPKISFYANNSASMSER